MSAISERQKVSGKTLFDNKSDLDSNSPDEMSKTKNRSSNLLPIKEGESSLDSSSDSQDNFSNPLRTSYSCAQVPKIPLSPASNGLPQSKTYGSIQVVPLSSRVFSREDLERFKRQKNEEVKSYQKKLLEEREKGLRKMDEVKKTEIGGVRYFFECILGKQRPSNFYKRIPSGMLSKKK